MRKEYKFNGEVFAMPDLTLGEMEEIQKWVDDKDVFDPKIWLSLCRTKLSELLSVILKPYKDISYWKNVRAVDPQILEVVDNFFVCNSPLKFLGPVITSIGKGMKLEKEAESKSKP